MIPVADITAAFTTLSVYILVLSAPILAAIGFRYGFAAAWTAIKSALGIGTKAVKTGTK